MTFSVVGRCAETGRFGVACTTSSICVGARCPWVRTGVGAVTTQFLTDPALGVAVLNELEAGKSSDQALQAVLTSAPNKLHAQYRQVACIDAAGRTACCTGEHVVGHAGTASGVDVIATGNLLTDAAVPAAMVSAFERTIGEHLAVRLLAALEAGEAAGGESDVCHSAVLLVAHDDPSAGWPLVNLRVDWSDSSPLAELRELWQRYEPQLDDYATRATNPVSLLQLQPQSVPPKKAEVNFYRGHSFLLYFDKATEAALASAGARLHGMRHLGVAGQRYGYRPHISLSICGGCDIKSATTLLQRMAQRTAPFELTLGALGTGGGGQGLFAAADGMPSLMLLPTVTSELLSLHAEFHQSLIESPNIVTISPSAAYFPGVWLPHVTMLQEIPEERLGDATQHTLSVLPALPMVCRVETIGVITFRPGCDVVGFELGSGRKVATQPTKL